MRVRWGSVAERREDVLLLEIGAIWFGKHWLVVPNNVLVEFCVRERVARVASLVDKEVRRVLRDGDGLDRVRNVLAVGPFERVFFRMPLRAPDRILFSLDSRSEDLAFPIDVSREHVVEIGEIRVRLKRLRCNSEARNRRSELASPVLSGCLVRDVMQPTQRHGCSL